MSGLCAALEALGQAGAIERPPLLDHLGREFAELLPWLVPESWPSARPA